jgi:uncharacterized membrane protein YhaH (DUF805 family)
MAGPLSFKGKLRPLPYALWSVGVFFFQHFIVVSVFTTAKQPLEAGWRFYLVPMRSLLDLGSVPAPTALATLALMLVATWGLTALSFRRAADANVSGWIAAPVFAPIIQVPVILILCLLPSRAGSVEPRDPAPRGQGRRWQYAVEAVFAGMALTLFAVALGALVFGTYGIGMFLVTPFVIGATSGYLANRLGDIGRANTIALIFGATAVGAVALVATALEGAGCIIVAAPLAFLCAGVGGLFGRATALSARTSAKHAFAGAALLPLVFASEEMWPAMARFETTQTIEVAAPADAVWRALVRMEAIDTPPSLPFQFGVAYPISGEIIGEGVGAERRGVFSTGIAFERVSAWEPGRRLAFEVISEPPSMRELSPYTHVHAPHVEGYFRTIVTSFELIPLPGGGTLIVERTAHELRLDPVLYWLPMARWVVHENNLRVLDHIRRQAERSLVAAHGPQA